HTCRPPGADRDAGAHLLLALATALALDGRYELWNVLNTPAPGDFARRLDLLAGAEAARVLNTLTTAQQRRDIRLVLVGRGLPAGADGTRWPPLPFPSDTAARRAFLARLAGEPLIPPPGNAIELATIQ